MKRYEFVSKSEVIALLIGTGLCALAVFAMEVLTAYSGADKRLSITSAAVCVLFFGVFLFWNYHSLVALYKITPDGVKSPYLSLQWEEIRDCTVFYPVKNRWYFRGFFHEHHIKEYPPMIGLGIIRSDNVFRRSKFDCVIVPMTQRNIKLIDEYWQDKSPQIREIIENNKGFPDYPDKWNPWQ